MKSAKPENSTELLPPEHNPSAQEKALALTPASFNIEDIFKYAIEHQGTAEVMEKLMGIRRELKEENAKEMFDEAMSAFQSKCPTILKEKGVPDRSGKTAYKYAPIEAIESQIRPLLREHGFSHTFDTDTASVEGWVVAKCIVTHKAGHCRISTAKFPLGTKTQLMSDTQVYAAALTFANRRALQNAYGLVLAGEDLDGQTGRIKPAGPSTLAADDVALKGLASTLWKILEPVRGTERNWDAANQWLWKQEITDGAVPETAPHFTAEKFGLVIEAAKKALSK
jgi:hypothetical protein